MTQGLLLVMALIAGRGPDTFDVPALSAPPLGSMSQPIRKLSVDPEGGSESPANGS
jgi:hypothetical protein